MISSPITDQTPISAGYARTAPPPLGTPRLEGRIRAQVAIVGAGFTGLSTALHLSKQGVFVAVVEGREVGWGGSGRAFGQVVPYAKHHEHHIYATFGPEYGERLINLLSSGPGLVFGLIDEYGVECEPVRTGLLFAAHTRAAAEKLKRRADFWQARSEPVDVLEGDSLEKIVGSRYYPLALLDHRGGSVNPLGFVRGLAGAAISAGARLFENSPAIKLARQESAWLLKADVGEVLADTIVLATDAYTDDLWPGLRHSIIPIRAYHIMSAPLSENLRASILPGGQSLTDSRRLYSGIRVRPDGRLHMSVDEPPFSDGSGFSAHGSARVNALFPQIGEPQWQEQVSGWVGVSRDQYPRIFELEKGLFGAVGLSGRGIAFGTLLGLELTKRVLRKPESECALPLSKLPFAISSTVMRLLAYGLINLYRVLDSRELKSGYVRPAACHPRQFG
jgi:glycine/D-amino acid oxidase-like deaminating enzyme